MTMKTTLPRRTTRGPSAVAHNMSMDELLEWLDDPRNRRKVPKVTGHHILLAPLPVETVTEGGIYIPEEHVEKQVVAGITGYVVQTGNSAYKGEYPKGVMRFPDGPWCKQGDFVIYKTYTGTRVEVAGQEFRIMNDDQILAVVEDPRGLARV
ncbi:MAG: co-chaperone GroES family protein [Hyphomicrobiales bacterium]